MNYIESKQDTSVTTNKKDEPKKTTPAKKTSKELMAEADVALDSGKISLDEYNIRINNALNEQE